MPGDTSAPGSRPAQGWSDGEQPRLKVTLLDPSLFTEPYDAALARGLAASNVDAHWLVRPARPGEASGLPPGRFSPMFYRLSERLGGPFAKLKPALKGLEHGLGVLQALNHVARTKPDVVHVQWAVIPVIDAAVIRLLRRKRPVVMTVHDAVPFNGEKVALLHRLGFDLPIRAADEVIVHTAAAKAELTRRGIPARKINIIPHGPLELNGEASAPPPRDDSFWTFVLFGQLKPYKGIDVLIEAIGLMPAERRSIARFIIAGAAKMDLAPIRARIRELRIEDIVEIRDRRHSEAEMSALFASAHCFVFPYRQIDASGVYFLLKGRGRWLIASTIGIFQEDIEDGVSGRLVPVSDTQALSRALSDAVHERPAPSEQASNASWNEIGHATLTIYRQARDARLSGERRQP
jgi:glycosyltransferase involved in cell wall biosynthesis